MIDLQKFQQCLRNGGVNFITGVPDTLLNDFCLSLEQEWETNMHVIAANEGNAIALGAGYYLASGGVPLVYMQNSGLGNATNPLLSLTSKDVYGIPMVLLIGWRGDPAGRDHPQHQLQGALSPVFLEAMQIPFRVLQGDDEGVFSATTWAVEKAREMSSPTALLVKKGVLEKGEKAGFPADGSTLMSREEAINCVLDCVPGDTLFVATTGRATRELHELRNLRGEGHAHDFLNVGAMGHASSIATGLALANRQRRVICLDGDGGALMHLGALSTATGLGLSNFLHIVLNNGAHESVGGQATAGWRIDFTRVAAHMGYATVGAAVDSAPGLRAAIQTLGVKAEPAFVDMRIRRGMRSDLPPLKMCPADLKQQLMSNLNVVG